MKWRKSQGFDLPDDEREGAETPVMRGDELPLVSSPQPRLSSSASSSLSSTQLSTLDDASTSTSASISKMDGSRTASLTALVTSTPPGIIRSATPKEPIAQPSPLRAEGSGSQNSPLKDNLRLSGGSIVRIDGPPSGSTTSVTLNSPHHIPISSTSSPQHIPPPNSSSPTSVPVTPNRVPVSPKRDSQTIPVSPVKVAVSPVKANGHKSHSHSRPTSGIANETTGDGGSVVVVNVNSSTPAHTTTVPITHNNKDIEHTCGINGSVNVVMNGVIRPTSKSLSNGGSTEGKRATHEKSKSVTIVVNDQQVNYSSPTDTPPHYQNGVMNGDTMHRTDGDSRPSSSASFQTSAKVDPDIQVRPLVGWGGGEGSSVVEDAASSDDCHRSTLTLVHSPARTYLSGDGEEHGGGAAWGSSVVSLCGVTMVLGAAIWLRLPRLIYQYGAGSFMAAWACVVLLIAVPLSYLEASLAQFSSSAALSLWRLVPIARGIGWSTVVVCLYWGVVVLGYLAPLLHYLILSLHPLTLQGEGEACPLPPGAYNNTGDWLVDHHSRCVYNLPDDWYGKIDMSFSWPLLASASAATLLAAITGACGPRTIAAITSIAAVFAILGLVLQFLMGILSVVTHDVNELWESARSFIIPQPHTLLQPGVWCAAVGQVLLSMGLSTGLLMSFSSRASFRFPLRRHLCGMMTLVVVATVLVALVVIMQLTLLASDRKVPIHTALAPLGTTQAENGDSVVGMGVGTAVITASHLLTVIPFPYSVLKQVFSFFIYVGLWCSGMITCVGCIHALVTALRDTWDCIPRVVAAIILAPVLFGLALPTTTKIGVGGVSLLEGEALSLSLLWPPLTLCIAITAVYGIHKVRKDFTFMVEASVSWLWAPLWGVILPILLIGVVVWLCVIEGAAVVVVDGPAWRTGLVWGLRAVVILPVPITAIYVVKSQLAYGVVDKVASSLQSSREWGDWGPQDPIEHHNWRRWREDETRPITSLKRRLATRPLTYTHSTLSSESSSTLTRLRSKYQQNGGTPSLL